MQLNSLVTAAACGLLAAAAVPSSSSAQERASAIVPDTAYDPVQPLVDRLDLERYKNTIKGLAQFGDRRQGTKRNRDAVDWIEAQLKQYGCQNVERITYQYNPAPRLPGAVAGADAPRSRRQTAAALRATVRAEAASSATCANAEAPTTRSRSPTGHPRDQHGAHHARRASGSDLYEGGTKYPNEMYIIGGHMDGIGWGQAVNDDASGSAIVMELARIFSMPDVQTERSIRFALWNNEETGLNGARAYVDQRGPMQGKESPAGSGKYPEPKWLGMIQHDMMMVDHGPPTADGKLSPNQRPEADINIEFAITSKFADESMKLAFFWRKANEKFATHYPASVGPHMTNTDSDPFKDLVPSLSLRENERGSQIGGNWDPTHHQPIDVLTTFNDKDYMLGLTSAQTTLGAIGRLVGALVLK
jgi:hypothetical protein